MNTPIDTTTDVETLTDAELEAHEAAARALINELGVYMWKIDFERWNRTQPPLVINTPIATDYTA
ncbi:hypothetical protein [Herpetosiphon giganteus]|uniref:hypothetical protein n=1 Tax=Herpetosiphon giganteus TaxID=2029754 RepID=UPI00195C5BA1|nr:hypothetical protein [Herpetosiphon giganteus]MBM7846273.1 hypothetical protein [Herpetosiphon giganteus]